MFMTENGPISEENDVGSKGTRMYRLISEYWKLLNEAKMKRMKTKRNYQKPQKSHLIILRCAAQITEQQQNS